MDQEARKITQPETLDQFKIAMLQKRSEHQAQHIFELENALMEAEATLAYFVSQSNATEPRATLDKE